MKFESILFILFLVVKLFYYWQLEKILLIIFLLRILKEALKIMPL